MASDLELCILPSWIMVPPRASLGISPHLYHHLNDALSFPLNRWDPLCFSIELPILSQLNSISLLISPYPQSFYLFSAIWVSEDHSYIFSPQLLLYLLHLFTTISFFDYYFYLKSLMQGALHRAQAWCASSFKGSTVLLLSLCHFALQLRDLEVVWRNFD